MIRKTSHIAFLMLALILIGCSGKKGNLDILGMFYTLSENSDQRFAESMEWNSTHGYDTVFVSSDDYRVYVMTDIHVDSTTFNLDTFTTNYLSDADVAPFCLCLGDIINAYGNYPKFMAYVDKIKDAGRKVYGIPGNHDIYYDQWQTYREYWKTSSYYFTVVTPSGYRDFFLMIDTSDGTFGNSLKKWVEATLREANAAGYRHITVCTHTHFWKIDQSQGHTSNYSLEETYEMAGIFANYGVEYVLQGHSHQRHSDVFKGVTYLRLDKMEDHYYNSFYNIFTFGETVSWKPVLVGPYERYANEKRIEGR